jgi:hypothetical protein
MKKLKLNVDELAVASFDVESGRNASGTVVGHATVRCDGEYTYHYPLSCDTICGTYKCTDEASCAYGSCGDYTRIQTCQGGETCGMSCDPTCYTCAQTC